IFVRHQAALCLGHVPCSGQPCQKHPFTNTAILAAANRKSGRDRVPVIGATFDSNDNLRLWSSRDSSTSIEVSRCRAVSIRRRMVSESGFGAPDKRLIGLVVW